MKPSFLGSLAKAAVPAFAVATCCFAAVALNASSVADLDLDETGSTDFSSPAELKISKNTHFVRMTSDGQIVGRLKTLVNDDVSIARDITVHFVKNGTASAVVKPNEFGKFRVDGLDPGRYSVVTAGEDGLAAYAVAVLPSNGQLEELTLDSAAIPRQDFETVGNVIRSEVYSDLCSEYCNKKKAPTNEILPIDAEIPMAPEQDNIGTLPLKTVSFRPTPSSFRLPQADTVGQTDAVIQQKPVRLADDGSMSGRIHWLTDAAPHQLPAEGARVSFVQAGEVIQTAVTNADGVFTMGNLNPGTYSVVATCAGQASGCAIDAGACCSAVQAVPSTYVDSCAPQFDAALVGCTDMSYTMDTFCGSTCGAVIDQPIIDQGTVISEGCATHDPCAGAGAGGFGGGGYYGGGGGGGFIGGGGGGGGFAGGGIGALGPLIGAGLGVGAFALIDDDDDGGGGGGGGGPIASPSSP